MKFIKMISKTPVLPVMILSSDRPLPANRELSSSLLEKYVEYMQRKFNELILSDPIFGFHIKAMQDKEIKAVVFGGWARDRIDEMVNSVVRSSNDIDMVASGSSSIVEILGAHATPTVFGGAGRKESTIYFDAWDLPNTFHIKRNSLDIDFNTLPVTADYTFNSIIFKPDQFFEKPEIFEIGAIAAIQDKVVEFQSNEVILPLIQASRAVNLAAKLDFELSVTVKQFLREVCQEKGALDNVLNGLAKYCHPSLIEVAKNKLTDALK
jgi:hypothetical protein